MSPASRSRARRRLRVYWVAAGLCVAAAATAFALESWGRGRPAQSQAPVRAAAEKATSQTAGADVEKLVNDVKSAAEQSKAAADQADSVAKNAEALAKSAKRIAWSGLIVAILLVLGVASVVIWQRWQSGALSLPLPVLRPASQSAKSASGKPPLVSTRGAQAVSSSRDRDAQTPAAERLREFELKLSSLGQRVEQIDSGRLALERKVTALQDAAVRDRPVEAPASPLASRTGASRLAGVGASSSRGSGASRAGGAARTETEVMPGTIQDDTVRSTPSSSRPMVEIRWRSGSSTAEVTVSPEYKFTAITGDYLRSFFDMDGSGEGAYETISPAVVHWSAGASSGTLQTRGRVRAMGV